MLGGEGPSSGMLGRSFSDGSRGDMLFDRERERERGEAVGDEKPDIVAGGFCFVGLVGWVGLGWVSCCC